MTKEMVSAKLSSVTKERLEDYAEEVGISRSEAVDRMVKQGLDVQESDMQLVPIRSDGGIKDDLNNVESELNSVDSELDSLAERSRHSTRLTYFLVASVIWIGIHISVGFPDLLVLTSGPLMIAGLVYQLSKSWEEL